MKILLDHNLDWRLSRYLPGHEVSSALQLGWQARKNGALLSEAEARGFAVLLTADKGIKSQQKMAGRMIAVIILRAHNTKLTTHLLLIAEVMQCLTTIQPGQVVEIFHPGMNP